ncbi:hypothetical protein [Pseudorhodoplanes sp.]|nr:hypothetical protein [Pseudorhodoplanes sp.]HWV40355.1 hypothetical protein [Pseudorhodoplanes sp.]
MNTYGLRLIGCAYGSVVLIVAAIAFVVVTAHMNTPVEARPDSTVLSSR